MEFCPVLPVRQFFKADHGLAGREYKVCPDVCKGLLFILGQIFVSPAAEGVGQVSELHGDFDEVFSVAVGVRPAGDFDAEDFPVGPVGHDVARHGVNRVRQSGLQERIAVDAVAADAGAEHAGDIAAGHFRANRVNCRLIEHFVDNFVDGLEVVDQVGGVVFGQRAGFPNQPALNIRDIRLTAVLADRMNNLSVVEGRSDGRNRVVADAGVLFLDDVETLLHDNFPFLCF